MEGTNIFDSDCVLTEAVQREAGNWAVPHLRQMGEKCGSAEYAEAARQANKSEPVHKPFDRFGNRVDTVDFHPSYHKLM
jgi:putative acyl-CoA dehydrogenase